VIHTGRSSMQVLVVIEAADVETREYERATHCILVFVAVDGAGKPREVPAWTPRTDEERALHDSAEQRLAARRDIRDAMLAQEYTDAGTTPRTTFRFLAAPAVVNWGGNAHGGTVMRWIDEAAFACATAWAGANGSGEAGTTAVAVYSGGIHFVAPVRIGDLVEIEARLIHTGERSMHLSIRVERADPRTPDGRALTTQCMSVFVVPGPDGDALPVPTWRPELDEDVRLDEHARELIDLRAAITPIPAALTLER